MISDFSSDLMLYCEKHSTSQSEILTELDRQTHLQTLAPQMLSGFTQGRLLSFISQMLRPEFILEIGTFTGYSALCLAEGLIENGQLHTIEINENYRHLIETISVNSPLARKIHWNYGDALQIIPKLHKDWDLVFIDGAKHQYGMYIDLLEAKMRKGSVLICDNMLWYGKVLEKDKDKDTKIIDEVNKRLSHSDHWSSLLLPLRDGLQIAIKK